MSNSFINTLKEKEASRQEAKSTEVQATVVAETPETTDALEVEEVITDAPQEIESPAKLEVSEKVRKQLSEKGSFLNTIKEKSAERAKEAAELEAAEAEAQAAEEEAEEAEKNAEETNEIAIPVVFEVDGQQFESPEKVNEYLSKVKEDSENLKKEVEDVRAFVEKVSDPEMIEILDYVSQGYSLRVAMIKAGLDESIFKIETGDEDAEALVQAKLDRKMALQNQQKELEKLQKNMEQSNKALTEFQSEEGFDENTKGDLVRLMKEFHEEAMQGLVSKKFLQLFAKALNYEKVVEEAKKKVQEAKEVGKIEGRNEKITIERQRVKGDEIPKLGRGISSEPIRKRNRLNDMVNVPSGSFLQKIRDKNN
jgi:hypothetical protein